MTGKRPKDDLDTLLDLFRGAMRGAAREAKKSENTQELGNAFSGMADLVNDLKKAKREIIAEIEKSQTPAGSSKPGCK